MEQIRVGVVRGGVSPEYDVSLGSGANVLKNLPTDKYKIYDILITKNGVWHFQGVPIYPETLPNRVDVIFNTLHGFFGEDGKIQKFFDSINLPYTGSGHFGAAISMNKNTSKEYFKKAGLKTPTSHFSSNISDVVAFAKEVFSKVPPPWVIKPVDSGSSVGVSLARDFDSLVLGIEEVLKHSEGVLVEELIKGKEAGCGIVENFRDKEAYSLFPVEVRKKEIIFDYQSKYSKEIERVCPGCFSEEEKKEIEKMSAEAHNILGLRHYSRSDFIVSPRGIYILETNSLPDLSENSLLVKSLNTVGLKYQDFLDHTIGLAMENN